MKNTPSKFAFVGDPATPGAGRKPFARPIKMVTVKLYCDQLPTTSAELRQALDAYRAHRAETVQDSSDQHGATAAQNPQS